MRCWASISITSPLVIESFRSSRSSSARAVEGSDLVGVLGVTDDLADARDVRLRNLGDVVGPVLPVMPVAALLDDLGVQSALDLPDVELEFALNLGPEARAWAEPME